MTSGVGQGAGARAGSLKGTQLSTRMQAEQMLQGYADAVQSDAGVAAGSIGGFVEPRYATDHSFYLLIVPMLSRCFPQVDAIAVRQLGLAFYGVFRMVLAMDRVADRHESRFIFDGLTHYTVALRRLSSVFPEGSPIWGQLTDRVRHSVDQIRLERELKGKTDVASYTTVAMGKSSLIQLPVDWLEALQPVGEFAGRLRASLLEKHIGMQWLDDINDFAVDVEHDQPTWARCRLAAYAQARQLDLAALAPAKQKRLMFACGLGEELLGEARAHFAAAIDELSDVDLPEYFDVVRAYLAQLDGLRALLAHERAAAAARVSERNSSAKADC